MPAVKIGRLGVSAKIQSSGVGSSILDFVKAWFTEGNKTGCRFILVDALNNPRTIKFYKDNGFDFLIFNGDDDDDKTRLMFFDLMTFVR